MTKMMIPEMSLSLSLSLSLAKWICDQDDVTDGDCNGTKQKNFQITLAQKQFEICKK